MRDERGDIVDLEFIGVLLVDTDDQFHGVAPHVDGEPVVDWQGGRRDRWRYRFDGATTAERAVTSHPRRPWRVSRCWRWVARR